MRRYGRSRDNLRRYMALADSVHIFDATRTAFALIWSRDRAEKIVDAERCELLRKGGFL